MASIQRFEEIIAWQKAKELVREVYRICADGKFSRDFGLKAQTCRAAVASMSNIAEGFVEEVEETSRISSISREDLP